MVFEFIFSTLFGVVQSLIDTFLPVGSPDGGFTTGATGWMHWFGWFDTWLPLHEAISLIGLFIALRVVLSSAQMVMWARRQLPFRMAGG